jgi:hypothetical protein
MVVPSTADGFRAVVSSLRSLDEREGVNFHTFMLPEDRCVRLLVKNLGRGMPESVVQEDLEFLNIHVQGVMKLRSGRRDQDHSPLHHIGGAWTGCDKSALTHRTLRLASIGGVVHDSKRPFAM